MKRHSLRRLAVFFCSALLLSSCSAAAVSSSSAASLSPTPTESIGESAESDSSESQKTADSMETSSNSDESSSDSQKEDSPWDPEVLELFATYLHGVELPFPGYDMDVAYIPSYDAIVMNSQDDSLAKENLEEYDLLFQEDEKWIDLGEEDGVYSYYTSTLPLRPGRLRHHG